MRPSGIADTVTRVYRSPRPEREFAVRRLMLALVCIAAPLSSGCATERQYFANHNPFTDTAIFVAEVFEPLNSDSLSQ
jgi:hypothetical protein